MDRAEEAGRILRATEDGWLLGDPAGEWGLLEWSVVSMPKPIWNQMMWADKAGGESVDFGFRGELVLVDLCLRGRMGWTS